MRPRGSSLFTLSTEWRCWSCELLLPTEFRIHLGYSLRKRLLKSSVTEIRVCRYSLLMLLDFFAGIWFDLQFVLRVPRPGGLERTHYALIRYLFCIFWPSLWCCVEIRLVVVLRFCVKGDASFNEFDSSESVMEETCVCTNEQNYKPAVRQFLWPFSGGSIVTLGRWSRAPFLYWSTWNSVNSIEVVFNNIHERMCV